MKRGRLLRSKVKSVTDKAITLNLRVKPQPTPLVDRTLGRTRERLTYVAMTEHGWGVDGDARTALLYCAEKLPMNLHHKPVQVALYVVPEGTAPTGFDKWPNGYTPRLAGLLALNRKGLR